MARSAKGHQDEFDDDDEEELLTANNTSFKGFSLSLSVFGLVVQHPPGFID